MALSERIRALVKDPALTVDPRAEALLYAAARAQLVHERLAPAARRGRARAARPLRRLLAGLPGRRARARRRARCARSTCSPPAACARPHAAAAHRRRPPAARASGERGAATRPPRARGRGASSRAIAAAYERARARPSPTRSARIDASQPPEQRARRRARRASRTYSRVRPSRLAVPATETVRVSAVRARIARIASPSLTVPPSQRLLREAIVLAAIAAGPARLRRLGVRAQARVRAALAALAAPRDGRGRLSRVRRRGPNSATGCGSDG